MEPHDEIDESSIENPYAAPKVDDETLRSGRTAVAAVFLAALTIPAAFAAFCCACTLTGAGGTAIGGLGSAFSGFSRLAGLVVGVFAARAVLIRMRQAADRAKQRSNIN